MNKLIGTSLRKSLQEIIEGKGFENTALKNLEIESTADDRVTYALEVDESICDFTGNLHSAIFAGLTDIAATSVIYHSDDKQTPGVCVDMNLSFMSPVAVGKTLYTTARLIKRGKSLAFCDIVFEVDEKKVCTSKTTHYVHSDLNRNLSFSQQ
eukprot:CAMPEP_0174262414 /NCGR_PEP_ID=MMETSP0439-20130205/12963_1 /TAXON_ID=0 /ORGANISM="Stereomyxa ramosa, Strain Chinc5" /LENGTH=152 /DNA_ID=CAMNT_0015347119 /DNA_START=19 /DNA_END=477 /DNA_ORIENTATION=-